jgi:hypothetical protein
MGAGRHGIILRSEWDVAEDLQQGRLLPLLPDLFQQADVWAVYPSVLLPRPRCGCALAFCNNGLPRHSCAERLPLADGALAAAQDHAALAGLPAAPLRRYR